MNERALSHLITAFVAALEQGNLVFLEKYLSADVAYDRIYPRPFVARGKDEVITRMEPYFRAFRGWSLTAAEIQPDAEARRVTCELHIQGANRGEMDFRTKGQGRYEATGRAFALPPGRLTLTVRGAEICRIEIEFPPGGGLAGIFEQIGAHR